MARRTRSRSSPAPGTTTCTRPTTSRPTASRAWPARWTTCSRMRRPSRRSRARTSGRSTPTSRSTTSTAVTTATSRTVRRQPVRVLRPRPGDRRHRRRRSRSRPRRRHGPDPGHQRLPRPAGRRPNHVSRGHRPLGSGEAVARAVPRHGVRCRRRPDRRVHVRVLRQKDKPTIDALNAADLEVSAVGNHEFDHGYDDLVNRVMAPYDATDNPEGGAEWRSSPPTSD